MALFPFLCEHHRADLTDQAFRPVVGPNCRQLLEGQAQTADPGEIGQQGWIEVIHHVDHFVNVEVSQSEVFQVERAGDFRLEAD